MTPLHLLVKSHSYMEETNEKSFSSTFSILIQNGADCNAKDEKNL